MKKIYSVILAIICATSLSITTVHASESFTITQEDTEETIQDKELEVTAEKGSSFTVKVPVLRALNSDWDNYKYYKWDFEVSAEVTGDIASDEVIILSHNDDIIFYPDGGLKEPITWKASSDGDYLLTSRFDNEKLLRPYNHFYSIDVHPNRYTSAGLWRGVLHLTVSVDQKGVLLTKEMFKEYIEDDTSVTSITIPKSITVDGKEIPIDGVLENTFDDFTSLTDIYLETDNLFKFQGGFGKESLNKRTVTIHGTGNVVEMQGWADVDGIVLYDNVKVSAIVLPTDYALESDDSWIIANYEEYVKDTMDESLIVFKQGELYGYWDTLEMNPDTIWRSFGTDCNSCEINKVIIPELTYPGRMWGLFSASTIKEAECYNYFVGEDWFSNCNNLTKVVLHEGVEYIDISAFENCSNLTEVVIPSSVKYIAPSAFNGTPFLENLKKDVEKVYINGIFIAYGDLYVTDSYYEFPAELDSVSTAIIPDTVTHLAFEESDKVYNIESKITKITTLDTTGRRSDGYNLNFYFPNLTKLIVGGKQPSVYSFEGASNLREIELVDGLETIGSAGFNHCTGYEGETLYIPKTVFQIDGYSTTKLYPYNTGSYAGKYGSGWSNHVFYDFGKDGVFKAFDVDDESPYYTDVDGILYTKDLHALVAIPRAYEFENGIYEMPNETRRLGELTFSRNTSVNKIIISDNLEIFNNVDSLEKYYTDNFNSYVWCMNEGNSLSLATYQFTRIKEYETRDTNPNYISIDGVLYTKDLKELVAVPHHYEGALNIPEGCEVWRENALWLNYNYGQGVNEGITSISIPSTMKSIDEKQLTYINNNYYNVTTVAEGNTNYAKYLEWIGIPRAINKIQTLDNLTYGGHTGTYWFSAWGNNANNIGADASTTAAAYLPIYIPEGDYSFSFDDPEEGVVRYKIIFGLSTGKVDSTVAEEVQINWTTEASTFKVGEGGRIMFMSATIVDENNTSLVETMTPEIGQNILNLFRITQLCSHEYNTEVTKEATCTELGIKTYTCTKCSYSYTEDIDKAPHTYENGVCSECSSVDIWHENAEPGLYDEDGFMVYTWDELVASDLVSVTVDNKLWTNAITDVGSLVIDDSVKTIGAVAFDGKHNLKNIVVPTSVETIENAAFKDTDIVKAVIPSSVTTFGTSMFWGCAKLETVSLPEGMTEIPEYTFHACESLKELSIPSTVHTINTNIFYYSLNLKDVYFNMTGPLTFNGESCLLRDYGIVSTYHFIDEETINSVPYDVLRTDFTRFTLNGEEYYPVMYNMDTTELSYVHPNYSGMIDVPEGCDTIADTAFVDGNSYSNVTRLTVPSSMQNISDNELNIINKKLSAEKIAVKDGNQYFVKYTNYLHPRGLIRLIPYDAEEYQLTGNAGYVWYDSTTFQVGASNDSGDNRKMQIFRMISIPAGTYEISWDTEETMWWRLLVCKSSGYVDKSYADSNSISYNSEKTATFTVNETNNIIYLCATFIDAESNYVTAPTEEQKQALVDALTITKVN